MNNAPLFTLLGVAVTPYMLLLITSAALCLWLSYVHMNRAGVPRITLRVFLWLAVPLGVICSRVGYGLVYLPDTLDDPLRLLHLMENGYVLYGAALGVALAGWLAARAGKGVRALRLYDILAPIAALMIAAARLLEGFVGLGDSFYTDNPALWFFPICVYDSYWETWALALFVLEALYALCIALVLWRSRSPAGSGDKTLLLVFLYAVMQIWFESLRRDAYARIGFIRVMQLVSAILAGIVLLIWLVRTGRGALVVLIRFAAYLALLGVVMLMEFAVEYKVGFLLDLHQRWQLTQTSHYMLCYGVMLMAVLAALALGLRARSRAKMSP